MTTETRTEDNFVSPWDSLKKEPDVTPVELERWRDQRQRSIEMARQYGWTKAEYCKRSSISPGVFYQWMDGTYPGVIKNITDRVEKFIDSVVELSAAGALVPTAPGYVATPTSKEIIDALIYAQTMPEIAVIVVAAGLGKTFTVQHYAAARPNVFRITMRPSTQTVFKLMGELADLFELNDMQRQQTRIDRAVGNKLKRNGRNTLLVVDEAQNLKDEAVNQLRYFYDEYGVGIALVGNEELYGRFGDAKPAYAQLQRRVGLKVRHMVPQAGDIEAVMDAWPIEDPQIRKIGMAIGRKPGALGQLIKTLQLASMFAAGAKRPMTANDVLLAARNRGLEG